MPVMPFLMLNARLCMTLDNVLTQIDNIELNSFSVTIFVYTIYR